MSDVKAEINKQLMEVLKAVDEIKNVHIKVELLKDVAEVNEKNQWIVSKFRRGGEDHRANGQNRINV